MSAEHFETFLTADMRTAPNGRDVEYAESGTGTPRWVDVLYDGDRSGAWASCYLYAENALELVARTIETDVMSGSTGDHSDKREHLAAIVRAVAKATRLLALDAACDSYVDDVRWVEALIEIHNTIDKTKELTT